MGRNFIDSLPKELVTHVTAICGHRGSAWFASLPETIRELEEKWDLTVKTPFPGIEFNYVAAAARQNGEKVVVKISPPYERLEIFQEAQYLRTRNGDGAIKLLDADRELRAILLERAIPGKALFEKFAADPAGCVEPAIEVMRNILRPPPPDLTDVELLDNWFARFQRYKDTEFPNELAVRATDIYRRLSDQPDKTFYLHGDFHPGNIVTSDRSEFLAIDPKGIVGHIGYDIAVFLNNLHWWQRKNRDVEGFLQNAIGRFSENFDLEEMELREWAFAYMVIGAWWNFEDMPEHYQESVAISNVWGV